MNIDMYKSVIENCPFAIGLHKIVCDERGAPKDYEFIKVNPAYEKITGFDATEVQGKRITEIFPQIKNNKNDWIDTYGEVAINGASKEFLRFFDAVHDYYNIKIYSPEKYYFITMFSDTNTSLHTEEVINLENLLVDCGADFEALQSVLDKLFKITNVAMAIGNLEGKLLVKTDFQDICKDFHRKNSMSCEKCTMSDSKLFQSASEGEFIKYKCQNRLWDISTPIIVAGKTIGAIYLGQFFYDDEAIDFDAFKEQAKEYGYNEKAYINALKKVPRVSHDYIENIIDFYVEFAKVVALLNYKNMDVLSANKKQRELIASLDKYEKRLTSLINSLPDVVMIYDKYNKIRYVNESIYNLLDRHKEDVVGKTAEEIWLTSQEMQHIPALIRAIQTKTTQHIDIECECPKGKHRNLLFTYVPMIDNNKEIEVLGIIHDYTERKIAEDAKRYQDSLISEMGRVAKIGGWEFDPETGKGTWTDEVARIHDLDTGVQTNMELGLNFYTEKSRAMIENAIEEAVSEAKPYDLELEMITRKGTRKWVRTIGQPTIKDGKVVRVHGAFQDISQRKKNEELIKESELRYRTLLEKAPIGIAVHAEGKILFANPAAFAMFGSDNSEQLIGKSIFEIVHPSRIEKTLERIKRVQAGEKGLYPTEDLYVKMDGSTIPVEVLATPIQYEGKPAVQVIVADITERKKTEETLKYLSYHDQLTGIYNRRFFEEELTKIDNDKNLPFTIIMADVNGLKLINDSFGHSFGDELLIKAAEAIKRECTTGNILARLGGDEFILALPKTTFEQAEQLIKRIKKNLQSQTVRSVALSVSFGYQTKKYGEQKIQEIITDAENRMYKLKIYESSSMHSKSVEIVMNTLYEKSLRELRHSKRVSEYCEKIAIALNLDKDTVNQIKTAGLVHDIGKIGIDEKILNKPGMLNDEEWEEIKKHPERGWRILITSNEFSELANFVLEHQERWDGKGYPNGLKENGISLEARIISLADAYDAMTSERTYRKAMSKDEAIKEIERNSGKQFDESLVRVFIDKVLKKP